jgi:uncharacterized membrane-anchored protein YitT (DUF2179 family)
MRKEKRFYPARKSYVKMKQIVFDLDPNAFMVVNDTLEVFGKRHGTRKVY